VILLPQKHGVPIVSERRIYAAEEESLRSRCLPLLNGFVLAYFCRFCTTVPSSATFIVGFLPWSLNWTS